MADKNRSPHKLIGQNYTTPDLVAKVTGKAKYAEDYRAEGMLFASCCSARCRTRASSASTRARRWRCPASRRSSPPTTCPAPPTAHDLGESVRRTRRASAALTERAAVPGRADSGRRRGRRAHRRRSDRERSRSSSSRCRSSSIRWRACGPAARTRGREGNVWMPTPAPPAHSLAQPARLRRRDDRGELKWTRRADFADGTREGQMPHGQADRRVDVRRRRDGFKKPASSSTRRS